jgi:hypothetical protein
MARIPTLKQWQQDTEVALRPRSATLKAVDAAIAQYERSKNEKDLWRIRNTFEDWKRSEGSRWQLSDRNRKQALTQMDRELSKVTDARTYQITHMTMKELMALAQVARQRKAVLENIFRGKQVTLKGAKLKDQLAGAGEKIKSKCQSAGSWVSANKRAAKPAPAPEPGVLRDKMIDMAKSYFDVSTLDELGSLAGLILDILGKCAVSVPPVVGHIKDGYDLFTGWAKVGADLYKQHSICERSYAIDTGVPSNAFAALQKCLAEETKHEAISATNATTSFALKTGLAFVDGGAISGPVVGAVSALADFAHTLFLLGMEYRASKAVNKALTAGNLDIRLFKTYPLMGCYLLSSATLSDLIPIDSFGTPGWMDYIESTQKNVFTPIYNAASELVESSPWEIQGLPKRPAGTSCGILQEAKRMFSTVSPLSGLTGLQSLAKS